jgi:hypothetical protein
VTRWSVDAGVGRHACHVGHEPRADRRAVIIDSVAACGRLHSRYRPHACSTAQAIIVSTALSIITISVLLIWFQAG